MASDNKVELVYLYQFQFLSLMMLGEMQNNPQKRRFWIRKLFRQRREMGLATIAPMLKKHDQEYFVQFLRMPVVKFGLLLEKIEPEITKKDTRWRDAISAHDRLCITLRFLATGETFRSLSFSFRMGRTSVARIIKETCYAIWKALQPDYVKMPKTEEEWKAISNGFLERWQLPNCCGSIDGKHVTVQCPQNTGSLNFNYKGRYSKVLIAVADSEYRFIMFEVGFNGSESDGGIFQRCTIGKRILRDKMNLPNDDILPYSKLRFPYFFIGDEAFPLRHNLMRPFPRRSAFSVQEKVYNYRISRARRVVENSFGILVTRFRVFLTSINVHETKTLPNVVAASIALHNFLLKECASTYCPPGYADSEDSRHNIIPGQWREINPNLKKYGKMTTNMYSRHTKKLREAFASYLTKDFPVDWQYRSIYRSNS